jgi:hypothetical protein
MRAIALDKRFVPFRGMADIADREVEVFRPEERDHHERLIVASHVRGRDLPLALGDDPMLHTNALASMGIGPAGNVSCGENVGIAGLQRRIDQNPAIQSKPSCLGELKARLDADAHDHKVRVDALAPCRATCLSSIRATFAPR